MVPIHNEFGHGDPIVEAIDQLALRAHSVDEQVELAVQVVLHLLKLLHQIISVPAIFLLLVFGLKFVFFALFVVNVDVHLLLGVVCHLYVALLIRHRLIVGDFFAGH